MNKYLMLILLSFIIACNVKDQTEVPTTQVKKGNFIEELIEEGTVSSVNATSISTPRISYRYGSLKISSIVEDGSEVNKGDTVIIFNPTEVKKAIIDAEQQLEIAKAEYEKMKATQESEIDDLVADLQITEISQQISQINFDNAQFESEITRKEIELQLATANISLERAREQIENNKKIHTEELFQKQLNMNQLNTRLGEANESLNQLFVVSPSNGIAIVKENFMTRLKYQAGEQPYSGFPIIDLPDLSKMMAVAKINEVDIAKVKPGLIVNIQSDAYSDTTYTGVVSKVANLAQPKDRNGKIKVFPTEILIDGENTKLLPGLTISCKIKVNELKDVLYVPVECLFEEFGITYVYQKVGKGFKRKDVVIAEQNNDFVVVREGLAESDEIALADPFLNKQEENDENK